jgi:hypothetical protein
MEGLHVLEKDMQARPWLPPESVRLWNIDKQGKLATPLDERGLVDLDKLVALGVQNVEGDYSWTSTFNDVHHLQWPAAHYAESCELPGHEFRELVQRKAYLPRQFHNWLHILTLPPPIPSEEVMRHSIDAERTARALASTAQLAVRLTRMVGIPEAKLVKRLEEQFENYTLYVENARLVPIEFQLLKLDEVEARSVEEMLMVNKRLGKLALHLVPIRFRKLQTAI